MSNMKLMPLGVCVLPEPRKNAARSVQYPDYVHEILAHAGLCSSELAFDDLSSALPSLRLLVTIGDTALPDDLLAHLRDWISRGGAWISVGGVCGMEDILGVEKEQAVRSWMGGVCTLGEGYLELGENSHPVLSHLEIPLHFFNGLAVKPKGGRVLAGTTDAHQRPTDRAGVVENVFGQGRTILIAPDVTGAVVRIQQGIGVTRDRPPAPDGSACLADSVLKSGDACVLDWVFDRQPLPGVPGFQAYLQPIADQWREVLLRSVFYAAQEIGLPVPLLWLYPRNLPAIAHLSHDSDGNDPDAARRMIDIVTGVGVKSTWYIQPPGYPADVISEIRAAGGELAMHFDAISKGLEWGEDEFDRQWKELSALFTGERPVSNRNHYLRWEGDVEFFQWCVRRGTRLDASKGATKTGEVGYNFGTCHPYLPVDFDGRPLDVLELCTPTQDFVAFAPQELGTPLLDAAVKHHGVLPLLFHPQHILKDGVESALLSMISRARKAGLEWWTAREIGEWERARRTVRWSGYSASTRETSVEISAGAALTDANVLWLVPQDAAVFANGSQPETQEVERWGFTFQSVTVEIRPDSPARLHLAL